MYEPVTRAHSRTIAALEPEDQAEFMKYLGILVDAGNEFGRAKLRLKEASKAKGSAPCKTPLRAAPFGTHS